MLAEATVEAHSGWRFVSRQERTSRNVARLVSGVGVLAVGLIARPSMGSDVRCSGQMSMPDCKVVSSDYEWSPVSQPTFAVECTYCPSPEAGECHTGSPDASTFSLVVAGMTYREGFEKTGTLCLGIALYRYKGPLVPNTVHNIVLPDYSFTKLPFKVGPFRDPDPTDVRGETASVDGPTDAAQDQPSQDDAAVDDGTDGATDEGGCHCQVGAARGAWSAPALAAAFAWWRRRRGSAFRRA